MSAPLADCREFEIMLQDSSRMTYFLDFLMDHGAHQLLMFWVEAEQFAEFTGDATACYEQAKALIDRYIGLVPSPDENTTKDLQKLSSKPRTTLALSSEVKKRLRDAVSESLPHQEDADENNSDDEAMPNPYCYLPYAGTLPEDAEEIYVTGIPIIGYRPPSLEVKAQILARIRTVTCDLFTDAQATVAVQLYHDWYGKFKQSSSYKRLCEHLLEGTHGPFEKNVNVETQLDTSIAVRRVVEAFVESSVSTR
jgi:hypothetical protein